MRGVAGIRALTFQLPKDLTRVLLRGLRSVRVGDGSLFQKDRVSDSQATMSTRAKASGADLVAANHVSGRHVKSDGGIASSERVKCVWVYDGVGEEKVSGTTLHGIYTPASVRRPTGDPQ